MQCEDYVLVNGSLFKIRYAKADNGEPSLVLCIPENIYQWFYINITHHCWQDIQE